MARSWSRRRILSVATLALCAPHSSSAAPPVALLPQVKTFLLSKQSGISLIATADGVQIMLLVINGVPVETHARQNGLYRPKAQASARSLKSITPVDFSRLITAAGGLDKAINGSARAGEFYALYNSLTSVALPPDACPADFAQKSDSEKALLRRQIRQGEASRFRPCFLGDEPLSRVAVTDDPFFAAWSFSRDGLGHYLGLTLPGVRAIWTLEI